MTSEPAAKIVMTLPSDLEIKMERSFAAPVELVFRAMTDPDLVAQWWGLRSTTTVVEALDLRPGGRWRFVQKGSNGEEWGFSGEIREVDPPHKVVQTFSYDPMPGSILETMTLERTGDNAVLTVVSRFDTKESRDGMIATGMEGGANESYDRLEELLASRQATGTTE